MSRGIGERGATPRELTITITLVVIGFFLVREAAPDVAEAQRRQRAGERSATIGTLSARLDEELRGSLGVDDRGLPLIVLATERSSPWLEYRRIEGITIDGLDGTVSSRYSRPIRLELGGRDVVRREGERVEVIAAGVADIRFRRDPDRAIVVTVTLQSRHGPSAEREFRIYPSW